MSLSDKRESLPQGRLARRKRSTRARLLEAAYHVFSECGIDDAKIKDITDNADLGFGTFYNYCTSKDDLAAQVLDCVIDDLGRRNYKATAKLRKTVPETVMPASIRLFMREASRLPMWHWWAMRPDLLVDRVREGFAPFAKRDIQEAVGKGLYSLADEEVDGAWALAVWMMVGGIHDSLTGRGADNDIFVVSAILRSMGISREQSLAITSAELPNYGPSAIDWTFELKPGNAGV